MSVALLSQGRPRRAQLPVTTKSRRMQLGDVPAGSSVEEIGFSCYDEAGRLAPAGNNTFSGRVMCGWMRKARKAVLTEAGSIVLLPKLSIPKEVRPGFLPWFLGSRGCARVRKKRALLSGHRVLSLIWSQCLHGPSSGLQTGARQFDLRFWDHTTQRFDIEAVLDCTVTAGAAAKWTLWPSEAEDESGLRVSEGGAWAVPAAAPFVVALELTDAFGNKCAVPPNPLCCAHARHNRPSSQSRYLRCRCAPQAVEPTVQVLEGADAAADGASRLAVPGCTLTGAWQLALDDETGAEAHLYGCEVTLVGDAGAVSLRVEELQLPDGGGTVPAVGQNLDLLPGASCFLVGVLAFASLDVVSTAVPSLWWVTLAPLRCGRKPSSCRFAARGGARAAGRGRHGACRVPEPRLAARCVLFSRWGARFCLLGCCFYGCDVALVGDAAAVSLAVRSVCFCVGAGRLSAGLVTQPGLASRCAACSLRVSGSDRVLSVIFCLCSLASPFMPSCSRAHALRACRPAVAAGSDAGVARATRRRRHPRRADCALHRRLGQRGGAPQATGGHPAAGGAGRRRLWPLCQGHGEGQ